MGPLQLAAMSGFSSALRTNSVSANTHYQAAERPTPAVLLLFATGLGALDLFG
jgi:hypothetical protein